MSPLNGDREAILSDDVQPTQTLSGDSSTGKIGLTVFSNKDSSGNMVLPALKASGEHKNSDAVELSGVSGTIALTTTAVELKIGGSRLANRKYIWMEAQNSNVLWGFSSSTCVFNNFKNQLLCFPIGDVAIFAKMSTGTGSTAFGEGA